MTQHQHTPIRLAEPTTTDPLRRLCGDLAEDWELALRPSTRLALAVQGRVQWLRAADWFPKMVAAEVDAAILEQAAD